MTREEAIERLTDYFEYEDGLSADKDTQKAYQMAIEALEAEPIKHGQWIDGRCSLCGSDAPFWAMASTYYRSNYCPNCGAKMDEVQP